MTVVYVDTLFLLNLTIDYLLLRLSARICGQYVPTLRLALGALMGAVYAPVSYTHLDVYKRQRFRIRPLKDILDDIEMARKAYGNGVRRVFLCDGDAIIMKQEELLTILDRLYKTCLLYTSGVRLPAAHGHCVRGCGVGLSSSGVHCEILH